MFETPKPEHILAVARSTNDACKATNLLRISGKELRRLIALYWPDVKPATIAGLHKKVARKMYCTIHLSLLEGPTEQGEPGEPPVVPEITEPIEMGISNLKSPISDMRMSNVACQ